jgi:hypothetical protein
MNYHQEPNDKELYHKSKELIFNSYKGNSPFRSGALVRHYKDKYKKEHPRSKVPPFKNTKPNKLNRFFEEEWVDIVPIINPKAPQAHKVFRPTKRVEGKTGALVKELSKTQLKKLVELKQNTSPFMPVVDDIKIFFDKKKGGGSYGHLPPVGAQGYDNNKHSYYTIVYKNGSPYEQISSQDDNTPYTGGISGYGLVNLEPDYKELDWGSFTKQFKNRKQKSIKTLEEYAEYIENHKEDFAPKTLKRARFYLNVILKRGVKKGGMIVKRFDYDEEDAQGN